MICEDVLVYFWDSSKTWAAYDSPESWVAYAGLTSAPFTNVVTRWNGDIDSLCSTSGRFAHCILGDMGVRIVDLF